jgi:hypothetical protein
MKLTSATYVPSIRWRQGEYQALLGLTNLVKSRIVPLITIPELEFDFEEWKPKKTIQAHVEPFAKRYKDKWGVRPAWIGVHPSISQQPMDDGTLIIAHVFTELRKFSAKAIPFLPMDAPSPIVVAVRNIVEVDQLGVGVGLRMEDLMKPNLDSHIAALGTALNVHPHDMDLVIDLRAPNFEPYGTFSGALQMAMAKISNLHNFRNFVVLSTSIPESFKDVAKGTARIARHDWQFYCAFVKALPATARRPNFGDYTIVHPEFSPQDMRKIKSSGKIVYATSNDWFVTKGGAFLDNPEQMHGHCAKIIGEGIFLGAHYSQGDEYIANCAAKTAKPSNLTTWKKVTINHHITLVVDDLAKLVA